MTGKKGAQNDREKGAQNNREKGAQNDSVKKGAYGDGKNAQNDCKMCVNRVIGALFRCFLSE